VSSAPDADFYARTAEEDRLRQGPFALEELRTRELIERYGRDRWLRCSTSAARRARTRSGSRMPDTWCIWWTRCRDSRCSESAHLLAVARTPA